MEVSEDPDGSLRGEGFVVLLLIQVAGLVHFVALVVVADGDVAAAVVASLEVFYILHKLKASFGEPVVV